MSTFIVLLDANVLVPAAPRDTLPRAADAGPYRIAWGENILAEVEANLVEHGITNPGDAGDLCEQMRSYFPEAMVSGHEALIPAMENDPKDRHVLAAAVRAHAQVIVTENLRDFPPGALAAYDIEAQSINDFLVHLFSLSPSHMTRIIQEQAADLVAPPASVDDVLAQLSTCAPQFVDLVDGRLR